VELSATIIKACLRALVNSEIKMGCYDKMYMLMNIHKLEVQGNLCDEQWKAQKHVTVEN